MSDNDIMLKLKIKNHIYNNPLNITDLIVNFDGWEDDIEGLIIYPMEIFDEMIEDNYALIHFSKKFDINDDYFTFTNGGESLISYNECELRALVNGNIDYVINELVERGIDIERIYNMVLNMGGDR